MEKRDKYFTVHPRAYESLNTFKKQKENKFSKMDTEEKDSLLNIPMLFYQPKVSQNNFRIIYLPIYLLPIPI